MIKIFISVRNRLGITKKCIEAIKRHSKLEHHIYVYNNATNYRLDEHFEYFGKLYKNGDISQVTFTTEQSTFNAFSKASTCNFFGLQHEQDPNKDKYKFLVIMDNDIIVNRKWDLKFKAGWEYITKNKMKNIKALSQLPGGIKGFDSTIHKIIGDIEARCGKLGGSGLWSIRPNFFRDVGFLNLKALVGQHKKHDQLYWRLMEQASGGKPYIMGLKMKVGYHCGPLAGSVCNRLTSGANNPKWKKDGIRFEEADKKIDKFSFDEFYKLILEDERIKRGW
jgi:hypothetical protein